MGAWCVCLFDSHGITEKDLWGWTIEHIEKRQDGEVVEGWTLVKKDVNSHHYLVIFVAAAKGISYFF